MTFSHGAGVDCPGPRTATYSRPPSAKPPRPLKNSSSGRGAAARSARPAVEPVGAGGRAVRSGRSRRMTWSARLPRRLRRTARAADWRSVRSSAESWSPRRMETPPRPGWPSRDQDGLARPDERLERVLEVLGVRRALLVEDHEVDVEELQPPVLVRAEQLPDDVEVIGLVDPDQDDRQVARDAVGPQAGCAPLVAGQQARRRSERRVGVEDPVGQALEEMGLVRLDPEVMELDLGLRPGEGRRPFEGGRLAVLVGQVQDLVARLRRRRWRRSRGRSRPGRA